MKSIPELGRILLVTAIILLVVSLVTWGRELDQERQKGWIDYENLSEKERLAKRPGNYPALGAISDFLSGLHNVRPDYRRCAFPFQHEGRTFPNLEAIEAELDQTAKQGDARNKLRQYNLNVKSLHVFDPDQMIKSTDLQRHYSLNEDMVRRLKTVRGRFPNDSVIVVANIGFYSLRSKKIESGETEDIVFYVTRTKNGWKVAWFDK